MSKFRSGHHALGLPVLLAAIATLPGAGSAQPQPEHLLPVRLTRTVVDFGAKVGVSGRVPPGSRARVNVMITKPGAPATVVASARPSSAGAWHASFRAVLPGQVTATSAAARLRSGVAAVASPTVRIRTVLSVDRPGSFRPHARVARVAGRVLPAAGSVITLESIRWRKKMRPARNGRFSLRVPIGVARRGVSVWASTPSTTLERSRVSRIRATRLRPALASFYDDYGLPVACGGVLGHNQIGVAHKTLRCGTRVEIHYRGRSVVAKVIDRGPYIAGREFDLTGATARALHFDGVGIVWVSP